MKFIKGSKKADGKKVSQPIKGMIENYDNGFVSGWVFNPTQPDEHVDFYIEVDGQVVAEATADSYREDLEQAGLGNGEHFFRVPIKEHLLGYGAFELTLRNIDGTDIQAKTYPIELSQPMVKARFMDANSFNIHFEVHSHGVDQHVNIAMSVDGEFHHKQAVHIQPGVHSLHLAVPKNLVDNVPRLISIGIEGQKELLWEGRLRFPFTLTPPEYLRDAHKTAGLIGLPAQAQYRYEALKLWLDTDINTEQLSNLKTAHSVVVEGWEKRKKFPKLELPRVDKPVVSIIIPAYNKFAITYHTIASIILAFDRTPYEVIVADDCSTDETTEVEDIIKNVRAVHNEENMMFLKSCNNAAKHAKGEYLLFLNNDTEVTSFWLEELIAPFKQNKVGVTGSKLLNQDGTLQEAGGIIWDNGIPWNVGNGDNPRNPEYDYLRDADYVSGASLCVKRTVWEEVGGFSSYLEPAYFEDTDIAFKVREAGYRVVYAPQSEVFHFEGMSHGRDVKKGVKRYQEVNKKKFAQKWAKAFAHNGKEGQFLNKEKDRAINQRILVIDYTAPRASDAAGAYAAIEEIKLMQGLGFKVTFICDNLAYLGATTVDLQRMGVEVLFAPFYTSVNDVLERRVWEFDAVYITRYTVAEKCLPQIKQMAPDLPVLFNNADLHFLRELRAALNADAGLSDEEKQRALEQAIDTRNRELKICQQADAVLCYNTTEHAVITSHILEADKLHVTPWVLQEKPKGPNMAAREGISFLGGYSHMPNIDAVEYIAEKVMPLLAKKRPDITLYVYGSNMPEAFEELEAENVKMVGFAEDLDDVFLQHRIFVAPLLSGAGIKGKVLEAMAYGTPTVLTEVAAEGTGLTHAVSTLIAQKPEEWVDAIIKLYDDETLWQQFADNSATLVKEKFSYEHGLKQFAEIFASVGVYART
ncbi:glycosyltransferase [Idiomarina sp.]|uniref:glycosyltransferase n=1 Tax=Idiomarina sp. TaxID=1874361 RepID=UPI0025C17C37|nr:glycosyltransferase [Idiomarina sp.]